MSKVPLCSSPAPNPEFEEVTECLFFPAQSIPKLSVRVGDAFQRIFLLGLQCGCCGTLDSVKVKPLANGQRLNRLSRKRWDCSVAPEPCLCGNVLCITGVPHLQENATPYDPTVGLCLEFYGGPRGVCVFLWARYPCMTAVERVRAGPAISKVL